MEAGERELLAVTWRKPLCSPECFAVSYLLPVSHYLLFCGVEFNFLFFLSLHLRLQKFCTVLGRLAGSAG